MRNLSFLYYFGNVQVNSRGYWGYPEILLWMDTVGGQTSSLSRGKTSRWDSWSFCILAVSLGPWRFWIRFWWSTLDHLAQPWPLILSSPFCMHDPRISGIKQIKHSSLVLSLFFIHGEKHNLSLRLTFCLSQQTQIVYFKFLFFLYLLYKSNTFQSVWITILQITTTHLFFFLV